MSELLAFAFKVVVYPSYNDIHDIFLVKYLAKGAGTEAK